MTEIDEVAERLWRAERDHTAISPVRDELAGVDAAYQVQLRNVERGMADGRRLVGRKIGLTSEAVQRQLGVSEPDFGALFADMCLVDGEPVPARRVLQPRVEAEVALVLGADLVVETPTVTDLIGAIDYLLPAIEVVGSRIANWDITIIDTVADNASSGMFVLGTRPISPDGLDLASAGMWLDVNGRTVSVGSGAACLGHPFRAAVWLARRMAGLGTPLRAGDVVMTGALGPMVPIAAGDSVIASIEGLGTVRTHLEGDS